MLGAYLVLGLIMFPVTVLITATAVVFGPVVGFGLALTGSLASAALTFLLGRRLRGRVVSRISGGAVYRVMRAIGDRGTFAVMSCRLVPVAPFTVVNLVAGALPIRFSEYLMGTVFGMVPGILALSLFGDGLVRVLVDPSAGNVALVLLALAAWLLLGLLLGRLIPRRDPSRAGDD